MLSRSLYVATLLVSAPLASEGISAQAPPTLAQDGQAAAGVVRAYYAALNARDYRKAYSLWSGQGAASGKSFTDFARGFGQTKSTSVTVVDVGEPEGAAGSLMTTISVKVNATLKNGSQQHFAGDYTLRRVNDVPGSTADQRRWHIESASLKPASH